MKTVRFVLPSNLEKQDLVFCRLPSICGDADVEWPFHRNHARTAKTFGYILHGKNWKNAHTKRAKKGFGDSFFGNDSPKNAAFFIFSIGVIITLSCKT